MSEHRCDMFGVYSGACTECGAPYPGRLAGGRRLTEATIGRELARLTGSRKPVGVDLERAHYIDKPGSLMRLRVRPGRFIEFDSEALKWSLDDFSDRILAPAVKAYEAEGVVIA